MVMLLLFQEALHAQYYLFNETPIKIEASFTKHSIESNAKQSFFNTIKVKNKSNRTEIFTLNITVPQEWKVIGQEKQEITIGPLDSIMIPVRVAVGSKVRGDIGYSIIASFTDSRGNSIKNEYCFIKIPRKTDLNIRILNRLGYLDPVSNSAEFSILVKNRGNREELVNFLFDGKRNLMITPGKQLLFSKDVIVPPYTDSTFTFTAELKEEELFGRSIFGLGAKISTVDTTQQSTLWFRSMESVFKNNITSKDKPLVVEVVGQGLLDAERKPTISNLIEGRTLFKGKSEIYYYYRNFASKEKTDFYKNTRMYIGGVIGSWNIEFGDNYRSFESILYGRGGFLSFNNKKLKVETIVNKDEKSLINNLGASLTYYFKPNNYIYTGATYSKSNSNISFDSKLGFLGGGFTIAKRHKFYILGSFNQYVRELNGVKQRNEYGGEFNYTSLVGNLNTTFRAKYGSELLYSTQRGRLIANLNSQWLVNPKNRLSFIYSENQTVRPTIQGTLITSTSKSSNRTATIEHMNFLQPGIQLYWGPAIENYKWSGLSYFPTDKEFGSIGYKIILGARAKNPAGTATLAPKVELARVNVYNNPFALTDTSGINKSWFNYQYFSLNFRSRSLNLLIFYTSGPRSVLEQISYVNFSKPNRKLQFMPAFDRFVYKDVLSLFLGLSYTNDIVKKSSYSNFTGKVYWYLPGNWRFHTLAVYSIQSKTNSQEAVENYQNLYVEAGLRKEFDLQQPRVKYYNIDLIFFKDFNGNYINDSNEPGIKNVLINLTRETTQFDSDIPGVFSTLELLSDNQGHIKLERIPEGRYTVLYNPVGKEAGTFSKALEELTLIVDKSKVMYIPFVEKNKVFGKIILSRSRLSGLGKIDVSNVRVTATDSKGRTYTTLTDKNGEFVVFAPVTDQYIVNINNIFYEDFDIRQNNFKVQFNGYKQFEVNFVFDEKIRRINFSPSAQDAQLSSILQVRKTNLKGTVKDAAGLQPIRARINLINTKNNTVLSSMYSSSVTGDYNMSFMADDNYLLEILADGYWYYSENLNLNQVTTFLNVTKDVMLKPIAIGSKIELNIKFEPNKKDLAAESVAELNRLLKLLKENENIKIEVQGHSDDLEALSNQGISEERAKMVARYLIENGFSNIQLRGFGNTVPIASNDTEQGRSANRRVEIEVVSK